jgi:hypothetical protein
MAEDDNDRIQSGILGDITPERGSTSAAEPSPARPAAEDEDESSMAGGSRHDQTQHSGSRDVTEGVTGGTGTEVGGTRNYRQGTGATGTDIGNRPE